MRIAQDFRSGAGFVAQDPAIGGSASGASDVDQERRNDGPGTPPTRFCRAIVTRSRQFRARMIQELRQVIADAAFEPMNHQILDRRRMRRGLTCLLHSYTSAVPSEPMPVLRRSGCKLVH